MIFTLFDRSAMYNVVQDKDHYYYAHAHEPLNVFDPKMAKDVFSLYSEFQSVALNETDGLAVNDGSGSGKTAAEIAAAGTPGVQEGGTEAGAGARVSADQAKFGVSTVQIPAEYSDQVMPKFCAA